MPPPSRPDDRAKPGAGAQVSWAQVSQELDEVEAELHALRGQYEQFFLGMEKRPPVRAHEQFKKRMAAMKTAPAKSAALSFRVQSLQASFATYERLWSRTMQEMEDGTYRRDLFKLRRKNSGPELPATQPPEGTTSAEKPSAKGAKKKDKEKDKEKSGAAAVASAPPPEPTIHIAGTPPPDPLAEARLRSVYRAYVEAKRRCNEDTTRLSFDAVAASLKRQVPELLDRHKVRDVEYRVFVKDGKAILRAVPKI